MGPLGGLRPPQSPFKENLRLGLLNVCLCCSFQHSTARRVRHGLHIPKRQQAREFSNQMPHTSCCHNICIMLPLKPLPSMPHSSKARKKNPIGLRRRPAPSVNSVRSSIGSICRLRPCFVTLKTSEDAEPTTTPDSNQQVVQSGHDTLLKRTGPIPRDRYLWLRVRMGARMCNDVQLWSPHREGARLSQRPTVALGSAPCETAVKPSPSHYQHAVYCMSIWLCTGTFVYPAAPAPFERPALSRGQ